MYSLSERAERDSGGFCSYSGCPYRDTRGICAAGAKILGFGTPKSWISNRKSSFQRSISQNFRRCAALRSPVGDMACYKTPLIQRTCKTKGGVIAKGGFITTISTDWELDPLIFKINQLHKQAQLAATKVSTWQ